MQQKYNSANTSINSQKVPAIFRKISWKPGTRNLDWGGGKYDTATEYLEKLFCSNSIYDPYNRGFAHNARVLEIAPYDTATVSNVLNVIAEAEVRKKIISDVLDYVKKGGIIYVEIYEGDKTGIGKKTKKGCWQNNMKLAAYAKELREFHPTIKNHMIIINKED